MRDGPGKPDDDDDDIKWLLSSPEVSDRIAGLQQLDRKYRKPMFQRLLRWHTGGLAPGEVTEIWHETMQAITANVLAEKFGFAGRLHAYVSTIARRRAIELLRKRSGFKSIADLTGVPGKPSDSTSELIEEFEACYALLPESLAMVFRIDVMLFLLGKKWPSIDELTDEVNRQYELSLSRSAVKCRRDRARAAFRRVWKQRGNDEFGKFWKEKRGDHDDDE